MLFFDRIVQSIKSPAFAGVFTIDNQFAPKLQATLKNVPDAIHPLTSGEAKQLFGWDLRMSYFDGLVEQADYSCLALLEGIAFTIKDD